MPFWEHEEQEKQKQLSQPNKFLMFFVFKNRKQFLKTPTKQTLSFPSLGIPLISFSFAIQAKLAKYIRLRYFTLWCFSFNRI